MRRSIQLGLRLLLQEEDPAWDRLLRRRLNRAERGLPISLTTPIPPGSMDAPLSEPETVATGPRPPAATAAALLLWMMGAVIAALAVVELGPPILDVAGEPAVDGLTAMMQWLVAGFFAGILGAVLLVAGGHAYAGWRIIEGVNWAFVEGLAMVLIGGLMGATMVGLDAGGRFGLSLPLAGMVAAYAATAGLLLVARPWFGTIRFPISPTHGPWWLRIGGGRMPWGGAER
ncbi:MAG: hypothetical protein K5924_10205 [Chloroflexi bacterium]|nr:hypothetical protein [Chloroflexota bacterium]